MLARPARARRCCPAAAQAHPLGNFSVNHVATVSVSRDRVDVRYTLDQAEIPTFQERGLSRAEVLARKRAEVARGLALTVDGARVPLTLDAGRRAVASGRARAAWRPPASCSPARAGARRRTRRAARPHVPRPRRLAGDPGGARAAAPRCARRSPPTTRRATWPSTRATCSTRRPTCARRRCASRPAAARWHGARRPARHAGARGRRRRLRRPARVGDARPACCCCSPRSAGARCTRSRPATARAMVAAYLVGTRGRARDAVGARRWS